MAIAEARRRLAAGRADEAAGVCRRAIEAGSRDARLHLLLGAAEIHRGRTHDAIEAHDEGLALDPSSPPLRLGRAKALVLAGRYDEALDDVDRVLAQAPASSAAAIARAEVLERLGRLDEAEEALAPWLESEPADPSALRLAVVLRRRRDDDAGAAELAARGLRDPSLPPPLRRLLLFDRGAALERLGRTGEAFAAFVLANRSGHRGYDEDAAAARLAAVTAAFTPDEGSSPATSNVVDERPLFVVSMPRSGSTLVERILTAHPQVRGVGESDAMMLRMRAFAEGAGGTPWPAFAADLDAPTLDAAAESYLETISADAPDATRIVDKNLQNFHLLGLVARMLPRARVIWCRRDPVATGLSCWTTPLSPTLLPWSTDLGRIGRHLRRFEAMMEHWRDAGTLALLEVSYEALVEDPDRECRRLVEFAGLPWDDACLHFERQSGAVATASYDQVRRPFYRDAIARHEAYGARLDPLRTALGLPGAAGE